MQSFVRSMLAIGCATALAPGMLGAQQGTLAARLIGYTPASVEITLTANAQPERNSNDPQFCA